MRATALIAALMLLPAPASLAQAPATPETTIAKLGDSQGWEAYTDNAKGGKICYLIGKPSKSEPPSAKRAMVTARVTHRPGEKRTNEVSFDAGYVFKEGSDADLVVDGKSFSLFTSKDTAWTRDPGTDKQVVEALAKGRQAVISGVSARGTKTTDTYALAGFSQALTEIDAACGVKR
jgi:hypothetical protein